MSRHSLRRFVHSSLVAAIFAISLSAIASAQTAPQPQWLRYTIDTVKPDMVQEYEGYKKQMVVAYKKAG